jgi:hypothetical protein
MGIQSIIQGRKDRKDQARQLQLAEAQERLREEQMMLERHARNFLIADESNKAADRALAAPFVEDLTLQEVLESDLRLEMGMQKVVGHDMQHGYGRIDILPVLIAKDQGLVVFRQLFQTKDLEWLKLLVENRNNMSNQ